VPRPVTIQYGPWAPDLQNVAVQLPELAGPIPVPAADCLGVYYQDGAYRCIPAPAEIAPSVGSQVLSAFTWYDESTGEEIVFFAGSDAINALIAGSYTGIPVGFAPTSFGIQITLGQISVFAGIYNGSLIEGNSNSWEGYNSAGATYLTSGTGNFGSISPTTDGNGHSILVLAGRSLHPGGSSTILVIGAGSLGSSYFTTLSGTALTSSLASSAATYSTGSGYSQWVWTGNSMAGANGTVQIT
jgi:hypothetical protein